RRSTGPSCTRRIRSSNGEIKRRTDVIGIFPNDDAIVRLVVALLLEQNDEWAVQRACYMTLERVGQLSDDPSSACLQWRADQPGLAGKLGDQCSQLHHAVGHYQGIRTCQLKPYERAKAGHF